MPPGALLTAASGALAAGRFRILSELGRGGMAVVYLAEDLQHPETPVALKLIPPSREEDDLSLRRFRREAAMLAELRHPHVLELLDSGRTDEGGLWLSMPVLRGEDLDARLRRGPLGLAESLRIAREVAEGLAHAHTRGIVHRDLKPSNVFLEASRDPPVARVLDFGIARVFNDPALTRLTSAGRTLGSPGYMSPEQILGVELDPRSDVYALGVMLFQMLTGHPPFPLGADMFRVLRAHLQEPAPRLSALAPERSFPPALEELVASMLEKAPPNRPRDLPRVIETLRALESAASVAEVSSAAVLRRSFPAESSPGAPRAAPRRSPSRSSWAPGVLAALLGAATVMVFLALRGVWAPTELPPSSELAAPPASPRARVVATTEAAAAEDSPAPTPANEASAPPAAPALSTPRTETPARSSPRPRDRPASEATSAARSAPATRATPRPTPVEALLQALDGAPSPEERVGARSELVRRLRADIAALPADRGTPLLRELGGLAATGSADGFRKLHARIDASAREGAAP